MSVSNSKKSFQRIIRYPRTGDLARHVELFEDNVAKKFRGVDAQVQAVSTIVTPEAPVDDRIYGSLDFSTTAGGINDLVLYKVPLNDEVNEEFVLSRAICWLTKRMKNSDTGSVAVRIGTTLGGNDIQVDRTVDKNTTLGIVGGLSIASRGSNMLVANGYEMSLAGNVKVYVRATTTGTVTQGRVLVELFGYFFPTADNA